MISVTEAKAIIHKSIDQLAPVNLPLAEAAGLVLAEDVYSSVDIPAYHQSSMDGYALSFSGWKQYKKLKIEGKVAAGDDEKLLSDPQKAVRIFTGAAVPEGADTVVMQEKIKTENGLLLIEDEKLQEGSNVRPKGSEIKKGELALVKGSLLSPAAVGFLAGIGITEVSVYPKPVVRIIVTGKELQQPGKPLQHGQVYESNSFTLTAALQKLNITHVKVIWADDDLEALTGILKEALMVSDVVLLTGGISVGDYDFVLKATVKCGVVQFFHKIRQRPGKPLFFGKKESKLVFGLPGNPSSVLTCFYEYVLPALGKLCNKETGLQVLKVPLAKDFQKQPGLTHFLKGLYDGKTAMVLDAQESYRLSSYAKANCLIQINEEVTACKEGEMVEIHLFPF
ncbi:MAG: molybdopterin molybdotransferase MoeA [Chitinophagaceae bacterium]|nr:molybdopterin molybdotransferase MoeA [Chitinophagaceae bacterium]